MSKLYTSTPSSPPIAFAQWLGLAEEAASGVRAPECLRHMNALHTFFGFKGSHDAPPASKRALNRKQSKTSRRSTDAGVPLLFSAACPSFLGLDPRTYMYVCTYVPTLQVLMFSEKKKSVTEHVNQYSQISMYEPTTTFVLQKYFEVVGIPGNWPVWLGLFSTS